jgi:hypothetical protein
MPRGDHHQAVINTIGVETLDKAVADVRAARRRGADGHAGRDPGRWPDAWDTEGNEFGLLQPAPRQT